MIKTRNFITVICFSGMEHRLIIASWIMNIPWPNFQLIYVFASLISFTLPVELVLVLVFLLFHWSLHVPIIMYAIFEILNLCFFYWLFEYM